MDPGLVEAQPGYAMELLAADVESVPDPFDYADEPPFVQGVVNFMLERQATAPLSHAEAQVGMGLAVLAAAARGDAAGLDIRFLRRGLHHHYLCTKPLPGTLDELRARYGDHHDWLREEIACSRPKNGPRVLWENAEAGVFVAETIVDGGLRETEVIFSKTRGDGQLDFAVYTPEGELTDRSTFATRGGSGVTSTAPYTCMACHVDVATERYTELRPTGTGAGCQ